MVQKLDGLELQGEEGGGALIHVHVRLNVLMRNQTRTKYIFEDS